MNTVEHRERIARLARLRGDRAAGLIIGDLELTQLQETGQTNTYVPEPRFGNAVAARNALADQLGIPREDVIPLGLEDDSPIVGFRVAA